MKLLPLLAGTALADQCNRILVPLYVWPAGGTTSQCGNAAYLVRVETYYELGRSEVSNQPNSLRPIRIISLELNTQFRVIFE